MRTVSSLTHFLALIVAFPIVALASPQGQPLSSPTQTPTPQLAIFGRAPYAITSPNFNCAAYQAATLGIGNYGIAFVFNTFGTSYDCLYKELANPRVVLVEAHLINGPCIRSKNCGPYEYLYGYTIKTLREAVTKDDPTVISKIQSAAQDLANVLLPKLRDDVQCYINPVLETNLGRDLSIKVQGWVSPYFKNRCSFVWNPDGHKPGLPLDGAAVSEGHSASPVFTNSACFANPDGAVIPSAAQWVQYLRAYSGCVAAFAWTPDDNCLAPTRNFIDPRARTCQRTAGFFIAQQGIQEARGLTKSIEFVE